VNVSGGHVLIIEDEPIIALELEALLSDLGYRTFDVADSPGDAMRFAAATRPDLITADYRIYCGTGVEAVERITAALGRIPVVYVTGNPDLFDHGEAAVVDKPISASALAAACDRAVTGH
jgi:CheY-like chemotaxis protein